MQIFRDDGTPYYVQLSGVIRRQIADEFWMIGDKLPTLKHLVATYGVSPMTVRHALAGLEKEGLISAERRRTQIPRYRLASGQGRTAYRPRRWRAI